MEEECVLRFLKITFFKIFLSKSDDEKGQIKKFIELKQSLECSLNQEMKKNGELEKEIAR